MNEHLPSATLHQRPQAFSHAPADVSKDLQPIRPGNEEGNAVVAENADGLGKAVKRLEVKTRGVEALELFFRKHSALSHQHSALTPRQPAFRDKQDVQG